MVSRARTPPVGESRPPNDREVWMWQSPMGTRRPSATSKRTAPEPREQHEGA
jgi:hypothetical protein